MQKKPQSAEVRAKDTFAEGFVVRVEANSSDVALPVPRETA